MKEKINYSLCGLGFIGKIHTIALKALPFCIDNVPFNINFYKLLSSRDFCSEDIGFQHVVKSMENIKDTDVVDICTPNFMHKEMIEKAIELGIKNIYCEKPLTGTCKDEVYLCKKAEEASINSQVAFMMRFVPAVVKAKAMIEEGVIGEIINFKCHMYHQSYLDVNKDMKWKRTKEKSAGGALVDLGVHLIDLVYYLLGEYDEISAINKTIIRERPTKEGMKKVEVDDFSHLEIHMKNGCSGSLEVSRVAAGKGEETEIEIFGTKGSLMINMNNPDYPLAYDFEKNLWYHGSLPIKGEVMEELNQVYPSSKYSLGFMVNAHMASLYSFLLKIGGREFKYLKPAEFKDAVYATSIIEAAYRSSDNNRNWIKINN